MSLLNPTRRGDIAAAPWLLGATHSPLLAGRLGQTDSLRFLVIGDWGRRGHDYQVDVASAMGRYAERFPPEFVISTGDHFYDFGVPSVNSFLWASSFEHIYTADSLQRAPWYAVLGNHDYGGSVGAQLDRHDRGRWRMPCKWYAWHGAEHGRPNVDIFFIDTVTWEGKENWWWRMHGDKIVPGEPEAQDEWLEVELAASTAAIKLVVGHHPIYSIGAHGGGKRLRCLDRLLCANGVTAYLCGHDHSMYHISRYRTADDWERLHYICSGAGSQMLPNYTGGAPVGCVMPTACRADRTTPQWHAFFAEGRNAPTAVRRDHHMPGGFAAIEVRGSEMRVDFIDGHCTWRYCTTIPAATRPKGKNCADDCASARGHAAGFAPGPPLRCDKRG